jgi:hypothetical protein
VKASNWKNILIILFALAGGFLLSFLGFGLLWSGIPWHFQLIMSVPFLLLSYAVFRWSKGNIGFCAFALIGAAPLGMLMTQLRDTNGSHLMPILVVASWLLGLTAGCYFGKLSRGMPSGSSQDITSS